MKTVFRNISSFILLILLLACAGLSFSQEFESNANARIIHNEKPLWGDEAKVSLEFVQKIGDIDAKDENFILYKIIDVERDDEGNIYVLDSGNLRIQKYAKTGKYLDTISRGGQGPGELGLPLGFALGSDGSFIIADLDGSMIKIFDKNGDELHRINVKRSFGSHIRLLGPETFIISDNSKRGVGGTVLPGKDEFPLYSIFNMNGELLYTIGKPLFYLRERDNGLRSLTVDSASSFEIGKGGSIYIAYKYKNRIEKRDSVGNLIFRADRPVRIDETEYKYDNNTMNSPNVISTNIGIDNENRLWVETYVKVIDEGETNARFNLRSTIADNARFEIFDREGILLGYVPIPMDYFRFRMINDRIYFIDIDRVSVHEYRIVEK